MKKIWELEEEFHSKFMQEANYIMEYALRGKPMTLKEVIANIGFNSVNLDGWHGYCEDDFSDELLNTHVSYDYFAYDEDGYREVYLLNLDKRKEKNDKE